MKRLAITVLPAAAVMCIFLLMHLERTGHVSTFMGIKSLLYRGRSKSAPAATVNCSAGFYPSWVKESKQELILPLNYTVEYLNKTGMQFNVSRHLLRSLGHPPAQFTSIAGYTTEELVQPDRLLFAVAASSNHYAESLPAIDSIQHFYPNHTIIFIDIGLSAEQIRKVKSLCNVKYFFFDFKRYPRHVKTLHYYAWKHLAILDILQEHPNCGVFYVDASARMVSSGVHPLVDVARLNGGIAVNFPAITPVYHVTHPTTFRYLVSSFTDLQKHPQVQGGALLFYRTRAVYEKIYWPLTLCLLDKMCIAPTNQRYCDMKKYRIYDKYADCHRYDQVVIAIILYNAFHFDGSCFGYYNPHSIYKIERGAKKIYYKLMDTC